MNTVSGQHLQLPYVETLVGADQVVLRTGPQALEQFAEQLKQEHLSAVATSDQPVFRKIGIPYKGEKETYYSYCRTHLIHNFGKQRLVSTIARLTYPTRLSSTSQTA